MKKLVTFIALFSLVLFSVSTAGAMAWFEFRPNGESITDKQPWYVNPGETFNVELWLMPDETNPETFLLGDVAVTFDMDELQYVSGTNYLPAGNGGTGYYEMTPGIVLEEIDGVTALYWIDAYTDADTFNGPFKWADLTFTAVAPVRDGVEDFQMYWGPSQVVCLDDYTYIFPTDNIAPDVSPVPIPGAVFLFGSGLLGLIGIGRRRAQRTRV